MNVRDSEAVTALMLAAGHTLAANEDEAECVIVNSCTVRQKAEDKAVGKTGYLCSTGKLVGLMGCGVKRLGADVFKVLPKLDFAVGPRAFGLIPKIISDLTSSDDLSREADIPVRAKRSAKKQILELGDNLIPSGLDAHEVHGFQAFVTAMIGCDNRCSYCIVPDVRGHEYSRPAAEIVAEVESLAKNGVKEVTLLGQSVLRYGTRNPVYPVDPNNSNIKEPFTRLLRELSVIDGLERIRFTSAHPHGCTDELIKVYQECPKVCRHLHLPVQSGSDRVLKEMGRHYTREEYLSAVKKLRDFDPEFSLTTDVIVGYPGETEEDFELTRSLMEEAQFDNAFIFKYSPRPGTRSAKLPDDVTKEEKERRDQVLLADQELRGQQRNDKLVGTIREVMVEGPSKRNPNRLSGRDSGNRIVVWDKEDGKDWKAGTLARVKIKEAHPQILIGEVA